MCTRHNAKCKLSYRGASIHMTARITHELNNTHKPNPKHFSNNSSANISISSNISIYKILHWFVFAFSYTGNST